MSWKITNLNCDPFRWPLETGTSRGLFQEGPTFTKIGSEYTFLLFLKSQMSSCSSRPMRRPRSCFHILDSFIRNTFLNNPWVLSPDFRELVIKIIFWPYIIRQSNVLWIGNERDWTPPPEKDSYALETISCALEQNQTWEPQRGLCVLTGKWGNYTPPFSPPPVI